MKKGYLGGKLKLKKLTLSNLIILSELLEKYDFDKIVNNTKLSKLIIRRLCLRKKDFDMTGKITPILTARIIVDFFCIYLKSITKKAPTQEELLNKLKKIKAMRG